MVTDFVIIVAAGVGSRMKSSLPKQFLSLRGMPVLMHTIQRFANAKLDLEIVVVVSPEMMGHWKELCLTHEFTCEHHLVVGGSSRFQSVRNGINYIADEFRLNTDSYIAVHDGARPLIDTETIQQAFNQAYKHRAVVVALPSTESVRLGDAEENHAADRDKVWLVQTPQVFQAGLLQNAYKQKEAPLFTDDASVVEKIGVPIHIVEGNPMNIKITRPQDIEIASFYLERQFRE